MRIKVYYSGKDYFGVWDSFQQCQGFECTFKDVQKVVRDIKEEAHRIDTFEIRPDDGTFDERTYPYPVVQVDRAYRDLSGSVVYEVYRWESAHSPRTCALMTFDGMKQYIYKVAKEEMK